MRKSVLSMAAAFSAIALPQSANAEITRESNHTLEYGEGVYNIQLIDIGELKVAETGDPRSEGELRSVRVELRHWGRPYGTQSDSWTYTPPSIWKRGNANRNLTYLPIRTGDWVSMGHNRVPVRGPENLWMHARARDNTEDEGLWLYFQVMVSSRELDCTRDRVCRRGNSSQTGFMFRVPAPRSVPYDCGDSNTWDILPIDGEVQVAMPGAVRVWAQDRYGFRPRFESDGPNLHLYNAKLCITRSTREPWGDEARRSEQLKRANDVLERDRRRNRDRIRESIPESTPEDQR